MTVDEAEVEHAFARLPEWRRPRGALKDADTLADTERRGIHEALLELLTDMPQTSAELTAGVREHWGEVRSEQVRAQLRVLVGHGYARQVEGGYVQGEE